MQFQLEPPGGKIVIKQYQPKALRINDSLFRKNLVFDTNQFIEIELPDTLDELTPETIEALCAHNPEVLIIGTGERFKILPTNLMIAAANFQMTLDVMDTHAACRTFTVLTSEGRNVVAALFL